MEILETIYLAIAALTTPFPIAYIIYKKGNHKLFFLSSIFGVSYMVILLLNILAFPVAILMVKVIPQLVEYDQVNYILPFLSLAEFIEKNYFVALYPVCMVAFPMLIFRRYPMFHLSGQTSGAPNSGLLS